MKMDELLDGVVTAYKFKDRLRSVVNQHGRIIILGNGGSNSVASHIAQDYTKMLGKKAITFSDPSRLTCYINDYGMEEANRQFVKEFADPFTLVIIISSSGNSKNMLRVMELCQELKLKHIILTGFDENNKMRQLNESLGGKAELDIWIDSSDYGVVECVHQIALHSIIGD